jgi:cation diffusion facilitator family transporter
MASVDVHTHTEPEGAQRPMHQHVDQLDPGGINERRTRWVTSLTLVTMVVEIAAGLLTGSMALLADGLHMATHAAALGIALFAYAFARRHATNARFSFGVGKVPALAGFSSAFILAVVALATGWESVSRLITPHAIDTREALAVAVLGLVVNIASLWLLAGVGHGHAHGHEHHHDHSHDHARRSLRDRLAGGNDQSMRGVILHVAADALTSVLAIAALVLALTLGWLWLDPVVGLVGMIMIGVWAWSLVRDTGRVLLDADIDPAETEILRGLLESDGDTKVQDLHLWRIGPDHLAAIVSLVSHKPMPPEHYKKLLSGRPELEHITIEVRLCEGAHDADCPEGIGPAPQGA